MSTQQVALVLCTGCVAPLAEPAPLAAPRIIAVTAAPAEVHPGDAVTYTVFVASRDGPIEDARLSWSYCTEARPLTENGAVAQACARHATPPLPSETQTLHSNVPRDACVRFGSEAPAGTRPLDADATGGYYQPVRIALAGSGVAVFRLRIQCALANAPVAEARRFARTYAANSAPLATGIRALQGGRDVGSDALDFTRPIDLRVELAPESAERYLRYDITRASLVESVEALRVHWYVSAGVLAEEQSDALAGSASNRYTADVSLLRAYVWAVISDDRGASSVSVQTLIGTRELAP